MKNQKEVGQLQESKVNVRVKIFALWSVLLFIYLYVDIFGFFEPGAIEAILKGKVWVFDITQTWLLSAMLLMVVPSIMGFLTVFLPAKLSKWSNIIIGVLYIIVSAGNAIGESSYYLILGSVVEVIVLIGDINIIIIILPSSRIY